MTMHSISTFKAHLVRGAVISAALWAGFSQSAWAGLITRDINVTLNAANIETYDLDVNLDGITDFTFTAALALDPDLSVGFDTVDFRFGSNNAVVIDTSTGDGFPTASLLQVGNSVSGANTFSGPIDQGNLFFFTSFDAASGNFGGQTGYLGLRFDTVSGIEYGFALLTINDLTAQNNPLGLTIRAVAFNDTPGQGIQISVVPEPTSPTLFGIGALGLFVSFLRRVRSDSKLQNLSASS